LAWVIIGGLISSLFLTLIIVPVIYEIMENWSINLQRKENRFWCAYGRWLWTSSIEWGCIMMTTKGSSNPFSV
jgi:hypothetical protein